jgi:hypothetical protein
VNELSEILRVYIEARFGLPIRYQTTREFLGGARRNPSWGEGLNSELDEFLRFFDRVKFAAEPANDLEIANAITFAVRFVQHCISSEPAA